MRGANNPDTVWHPWRALVGAIRELGPDPVDRPTRKRALAFLARRPRQLDGWDSGARFQLLPIIWNDALTGWKFRRLVERSGVDTARFEAEMLEMVQASTTGVGLNDQNQMVAVPGLLQKVHVDPATGAVDTDKRNGRPDDRVSDYLADRVAIAYVWLTNRLPSGTNAYQPRSARAKGYYRLGEAAFKLHGIMAYDNRLAQAAARMRKANEEFWTRNPNYRKK